MKDICKQLSNDIPATERYDVVVCGGGPAGVAAALAARREGLSVLIVEGQGQLGGMATSGLVSHWLGGRTADGRYVVGGLFRTMVTECVERGYALLPVREPEMKYTPHGWLMGLVHGVPLEPYGLAHYLDAKMQDAGVNVLLMTQAVQPVVNDHRVEKVILFNKSGLFAVECKALIDATGDADMAARGGCGYDKGRDEDGATTPVTLEVHVDNVDQDKLSDYIHSNDEPRFKALIKHLRETGEWPFSTEIFISVQLTEKGVMMLNTSRVCGIDGTDGRSITRGLQQGRAETMQLIEIAKKHFPGFKNARIKAVAPLLGVRETRRIHGECRLRVSDLMDQRDSPDVIGYTSYGWDLPHPDKPSLQPMHGKPMSPVTPIPYGIMVPKGKSNIICPGRAVSCERDVLGPLRVMAPCMAMGEAAGVAASLALSNDCSFAQVDNNALRSILNRHDAIVESPA